MTTGEWITLAGVVVIPLLGLIAGIVKWVVQPRMEHQQVMQQERLKHQQMVELERLKHQQMLELERLKAEQAKEQAQWEILHARLRKLKDAVGYLHEHLMEWNYPHRYPELWPYYRELDNYLGQFSEHDTLTFALRRFQHTAAMILDIKGQWDSNEQREEYMANLHRFFHDVTAAVDALLDAKRPTTVALPDTPDTPNVATADTPDSEP